MNVPKLRFKEYSRDSTSAWVKAPLKEFIDDHKGGASLRPSDFLPSGKFEVIPKKAISSGGRLNLDKLNPTYCTETFFSNNQSSVIDRKYLVTTLRDLVPSGPSIGYIVKIEDDRKYLLAQGVYGIKIKDELDEEFLIQFSNTIKYRELMQTMMVGSTQVHIRNGDFFKLLLGVPSIEEQQKIASFLSRVDQKISLLTKNYELLAQYKKGVMQKIFNQEIRFKDSAGKDFPDWEYVPLEEVLDYEQPGHYLVSSTKYSDNFDTPVLTAGKTFLLGYTDEINGIFTDLPVIIFDDFTTAFKFVDFPFKAKSSAMKMLKNINSDNYLRYIYEAMCRIDFQGGDEHKRYWISQYSKITIPLPHHDEQIKILEFSAGIDKKIEIIKSKLELTKQYKQGLLQQMFI